MSLSFFSTVTSPNLGRKSFGARYSTAPTFIHKRVSCKQQQQHDGQAGVSDEIGSGMDRRNVLVGLGGLCGAAVTISGNTAAGAPLQPPDLSACHAANDLQLIDRVQCCPPYGSPPIVIRDFVLPDPSEPLRVRKSTQTLERDPVNLAKFRKGIELMKALPADDPWSFMQQAQVHCAYCNDAYDQVGFDPVVTLQLHGGWHFLPWHRYYIYFFERILGKLLDDPTFAIPYWNYDQPSGMRFPEIYKSLPSGNPLYDCVRNPEHMTNALMNYKYEFGNPNPTPEEEETIILANQKQLHDMFAENLFNPENFMGQPIVAGQVLNGPGVLENLHITPHRWCSQVERPRWNMGNFHTAARDPIFYAHHGQIDRLWSIYKTQRGTNKPEFEREEWLNASYIFYDENRNIVNCKVRDCLDPTALRYMYETDERAWLHIRRSYFSRKRGAPRSAAADEMILVSEFGNEPRLLDTTIRALVTRPQVSRSKDGKEDESEVIFIDDFKFKDSDYAGFDVYIAKPTEGLVTADLGEFAGAFVHIPHTHGPTDHKHVLRFGITYMLEDIDAEASEQLVVSLVPRSGDITISGVSIQLVPRQTI